jgi:hypothetical protein
MNLRTESTEKVNFRCSFCPMDFLTAAERNVHVTLEHRSVKTAYECQVCMKQFALRAGLSIHQRTVTESRCVCDRVKHFYLKLRLNLSLRLVSVCGKKKAKVGSWPVNDRKGNK